MSDFRPPPRIKTPLDHPKLKLSSPSPNTPGKLSNLVWGLYEGNPRLTVYIGDQEGSKLSANLDVVTFYAFIELLKKAVTAELGWYDKIVNKNFTWYNQKRSETPEVVSELIVGRDKEGQIWISVSDNKPVKVRFFIVNPEYHTLVHGTGEPFTKAETSSLFTLGYINLLEKVVAQVFNAQWPEAEAAGKKRAEAAAAKRGGGGGYGNAGGGGNRQGGGYNNSGGARPPAPAPAAETASAGGDDYPF